MRRKYVEERYRCWFVFGGSKGLVDINDGDRDVMERVPEDLAKVIIEEHNKLVEVIGDMALDWDSGVTFDAHWYSPSTRTHRTTDGGDKR